MTKAERAKKQYNDRKEQGLCAKCGKVPARNGKTTCGGCAEKQKEKYKADRDFFLSLGLCPKCGKNKLFGTEKNCPECNAMNGKYLKDDYAKKYYKTKKEIMRKKNLCMVCCKSKGADERKWGRAVPINGFQKKGVIL